MNESFSNKFLYNQFNSHYQTPESHYKNSNKPVHFFNETNKLNSNNINNQSQNDVKVIQRIKPNNDLNRIQNNQIKPQSQTITKTKNEFDLQNYDQSVPIYSNNNNNNNNNSNQSENGAKVINKLRPNNLNLQPKTSKNFQQGTFQFSQPQPQPHPYMNPNFNYNNVLAFPPAFSHQLATLTVDQQNYLLQQQKLLVMAMAASEQRNSHVYLPPPQQQQQQQQQQIFFQNHYPYPSQYDYPENQTLKQGNNSLPVLASFFSSSTATSSSSPSSPMLNKNIINNHTNSHLNSISQNSNNKINYDSNITINSSNKYQEITSHKLNSQFHQANINNLDLINHNKNNNNNNLEFKNDSYLNIMENKFGFIPQNLIDQTNTNSLGQMTLNNDKIRFLANQTYRQHR